MSAWSHERGGPLADADADAIIALLRSWQTAAPVALDPSPIAGDTSRGIATYDAECLGCHGAKGEDGRYVQIGNPVFLASASDAYLRAAVEQGRGGTPMATFGSRLDSGRIADLVALVRSWQRPLDGPETLPPGPGGLKSVVLNEGGPDPAWEPTAQFISADAVKAAIEGGASLIVADARPASDYAGGHIAGAISLPFYRVADFLPELPRNKFVITYCSCPHAESGHAATTLTQAGYARVAVLDEGFKVWRGRGYPVRSGGEP